MTKLRDSLFDKQLDTIADTRSPYTAICCSRRAGKTSLIARWLLLTCLGRSRTEVVYFATTAKSAREIIWDGPDGLPALIKEFNLGAYAKLDEGTATAYFENGTVLHVTGAETKADAASWLGHKYALIVIDEAQSHREEIITYLVQDVLTPTLVDHRGRIVMAGVPRVWCAGFWHEAATGTGRQAGVWVRKGWTMFDNPHLQDPRGWLDNELALKAQSEDDPEVQRNYFGRWIRDEKAQLFQYLPGRNDFEALPGLDDQNRTIEWSYVLGMDIGRVDLSTFVLCAWSSQSPCVYVLKAEGHQGILEDQIAAIIRTYQVRYGGQYLKLVADTGALGKLIYDNITAIHGLVFEPADKREKAATIREMNTAMRLGNVKYRPDECKALCEQLMALEMDPKTQIEKKESPCDFADANLYAWRWTYSHTYAPPKQPPTVREAELLAWNAEQERARARFAPQVSAPPDRVLAEMEAMDELLTGGGFE